MKNSQKPFYKKFWPYVIASVILTLGFIPYGVQGDSILRQLFYNVGQIGSLYVKEPLENIGLIDNSPIEPPVDPITGEYPPEEEQEDCCWATVKDPVLDRDVWPANFGNIDADDPRLNELPPDYFNLWDVDFYSLEQIPNPDYNPTNFRSHKFLQYIYREGSTDRMIVDLTLDGLILKLDPSYQVGWESETDTDVNGSQKYRKVNNLKLSREVEGEECRMEIYAGDWFETKEKYKRIDHPKYEVFYEYNISPSIPDDMDRSLLVKLDRRMELSQPVQSYSISLLYGSPKKCYETDLELDILKSIELVPKELEQKRIDFDEPDRFPEPWHWPKELSEEFNVTSKKQYEERNLENNDLGYKATIQPGWIIHENKNKNRIEVQTTRQCYIHVFDSMSHYKELGARNINEYHELNGVEIDEDWGIFNTSTNIQRVPNSLSEVYRYERTSYFSQNDYFISSGYNFVMDDNIITIEWLVKDDQGLIQADQCTPHSETFFEGFSLLK